VRLRLDLLAAQERPSEDSTQPNNHDCEYVTLNQMAGWVNRSKRTLERLKAQGKLPDPDAEGGGGGKSDEWLWSKVRPILETEYGKSLPEHLPTAPRRH
jgi:hypothetical protein